MSVPRSPSSTDVAVVGMAGRFPGARSISEFWRLIRDGRDATQVLSDEQLAAAGVPEEERRDPRYVPVWAGIEGVDLFDAAFFGYSPRDAELIDPQQRILLECSWEALEDAAFDPGQFPGEIGVYAASGLSHYLLYNLAPNDEVVRAAGALNIALGNDKDYLSTRISYKLNLTGPSVNVQTNCSSGLVAVHHAIASLLDYQCDLAVVGAVSIRDAAPAGYLHEVGGTSSPSGRIRAFDQQADGHFISDGVAAIVLRRGVDAVQGNDHIYAMLKGSAVKNDGAAKAGFAATSRVGQVRTIKSALSMAAVAPQTVRYVEASGSGTLMGDAIELAAIREAYGPRDAGDVCVVGSVKPNVGHLATVSGLASMIKAVLALQHGQIPPTLNFSHLNRQADLDARQFVINAALRDWEPGQGPRRAGVSSFGVGGTNAHLILEEAPPPRARPPEAPQWHLIAVSAATPQALTSMLRCMASHLERAPGQSLGDIAFTSQVGRRPMAVRWFVVATAPAEAARMLRALAESRTSGSHKGRLADPAALVARLRQADAHSEGYRVLLAELGDAWCAGASVDWASLHDGVSRARVALPTYQFQRQVYWIARPARPRLTAHEASADQAGTGPGHDPARTARSEVPTAPLEVAIGDVWRRLLGVAQIGLYDSFLELGGDSMSAARTIAEIAEAFHVDLNIQDFLETPTIAAIAAIVDRQLAVARELRSLLEAAEPPEAQR